MKIIYIGFGMRPKFFIIYNSICCLLVAILLCLVPSCTYQDRVAPIRLPDGDNGLDLGNGLKLSATAFVGDSAAADALGFDARNAGLLPVQVTFQNDSPDSVSVVPEQTFLIDSKNDAWPVASLERTYQRAKGHVDVGETLAGSAKPAVLLGVAGAVAGLAVGIVSDENIGESMGKGAAVGGAIGAGIGGTSSYESAKDRIRDDLADKRLSNAAILPGQIAYGILFFPGKPEEARGAKELRLFIDIAGSKQVVKLSL